MFFRAFLFFFLLDFSRSDDSPVDKTDWIDPGDPTRRKVAVDSKLVEENRELRRRISEFENANALIPLAAESCDRFPSADEEIIIFKHFLRKLTKKFPTPGVYTSEFHFPQRSSKLWREFLDSTSVEAKILHDVADSVADLFVDVRHEKIDRSDFFSSTIDFVRSYLPLLNVCVLLPAVALLLIRILRVSRFQLTLWIFFLIFWWSIVWTWIHLWKERQAEIQARFVRSNGAMCKQDATTSWEALKNYLGSLFRFKPDDPCVEYFKDVMIDPIWTVTPLEAVSTAITKFFVRPLEPLADGISRFWRAFLKDLPLTAYLVILPMTAIFMGFLILALCGYRLRFGFGLISLEPSPLRFEGLANLLEHRETVQETTQTIPSVTWTRNLEINRLDRSRSHIRRASVSS